MKTTTLASHTRREDAVRARIAAFRNGEDGSLIIFGLFIFLLMLMVGGLAVDLMRLETTRVKLQGTSDRCALSAADLDQKLEPNAVVTDCFAKAGMSEFQDGPAIIDQGVNYRVVTVNAKARVPMLFSNLLSVFGPTEKFGTLEVLTAPGTSTAEERITDVEISLVLDMSSSMQQNSKLPNLRTAAKAFIETVLQNNEPSSAGLTTVSIVPYSAVVNPGVTLAPFYAMTNEHDYSSCLLANTSEFNGTWINPSIVHQRVSQFDYGAETNTSQTPIKRPWCFKPDENPIVVHSYDATQMKTAVDNLVSFGNTAIDLGMIWASTLLDPRTRPIVNSLISTGAVQADAVDRPAAWDAQDALKIIVLMTDGENTQEYDLSEPYKSGLSSIWVNKQYAGDLLGSTANNRFSVQYEGQSTTNNRSDDKFYWLGQSSSNTLRNYPNGFPGGESGYRSAAYPATMVGKGVDYTSTVRQLSWQDVYATWVRTVIYNKFFNAPYNAGKIDYNTYTATYYALETVVNDSQADTRLANVCQAAKDEGVIIYTVAFEAPSGGQAALLDCATSPSHYYNVAGTNIRDAFASIASDIANLKLTQ